ncbi:hypothetical protein [Fulvivirga lutimaris]|uniref:hypothetical protein n=1 Tax=Fulvivirga lutimaris TaxID=1819566 RepID=UPI0012BD0D3E|nr:hypothetical protein [Fulvivirga lutimaris]MTI39178.1 hypothetical protein [Fulvivirga lutimaris]
MIQMKMMKYLYSIAVALMFYSGGYAAIKGDVSSEKTLRKSYKVDKKASLEIGNKYGQVIINSWAKDSVVIKVKVTSFAKDQEAADKMLDRVEFDFNRAGEFVIAETVIDRSKGFLKDLWDDLGNYSRGLLSSKGKVTVSYEVYAPKYANIKISNKFGDIYMDNFKGDINIDLANGNLKTDEIIGGFDLDLSFGRANINTINNGVLVLRSADVEIERAKDIDLTSSSSTLLVSKLSLLKMESRNDKLRIDSLQVLRGNSSFTKINVKSLTRTVFADMNYGELNIELVKPSFRDIELLGKSTDFDLLFIEHTLVNINLVGKESNMLIGSGEYEKSVYENDDKLTKVIGTLGTGKEKNGTVNIHADGGKLSLRYTLN